MDLPVPRGPKSRIDCLGKFSNLAIIVGIFTAKMPLVKPFFLISSARKRFQFSGMGGLWHGVRRNSCMILDNFLAFDF